ncbi:MAG: tetratricopeptide repeat protein [Myxococcota bacterium]
MRSLLPLLVLVFAAPLADAAPKKAAVADEDVDHVVVAAVLIGDGHFDRALRVLDDVDLDAQDEGYDTARYWRLRGLCHVQLGATADAVTDFRNAIAAGEQSAEVWLRLAQAQITLGDHAEALATLEQAGPAAFERSAAFMIKARALNALERYPDAWTVLRDGRARFPDEIGFDRELLYLLINLELYREAREAGERYLARVEDDPTAWLAVGEAMRRSGNLQEASTVLEGARVRFPAEADAYTLLAKTYVDRGMHGACGSVLQQAAELDPVFAAAAADCFRDSGQIERAFYMNTQVPDAKMKATQRLDLLVRAESWPQAVALLPRLSRLGLLDEDPVAYAAAYALFQQGEYVRAELALKTIDDPKLFQDAAALRKAMADCSASPGSCL